MTSLTNMKTFSERPYYDDYDDLKDYLQILFRPSMSVQARELTQMQTILQNQIARVGGHFFDNGARILGGETKLRNKVQYITFPSNFIRSTNLDFSKATIKKTGTELTAQAIHYVDKGDDNFTLYIDYTSSDVTVTEFAANDILEISVFNTDNSEYTTLTTFSDGVSTYNITVDSVGYGALFSVNDGIYFINSRFVLVAKQTLIISKYIDVTVDDSSEINIGFKISDAIITPEMDNTLYDNAIGASSESAPGATRYKMNVELALKTDLTPDELNDYIQLLLVRRGTAVEKQNLTDYTSLFLELFARRTYDESGDYIVNDFLLDVREQFNDLTNRGYSLTGDKEKATLILDAGKAYVRGFEIESLDNTVLETDKARTVAGADEIYVSTSYESYVIIDLLTSKFIPSNLFYQSNGRIAANKLYFRTTDSIIDNSNVLFTAYPMSIENQENGRFKVKFSGLTSVNTGVLSSVTHITALSDFSGTVIKMVSSSSNSKLLYKLPYSVVKTVTDAQFYEWRVANPTIAYNGSNECQISVPVSNGQLVTDSNVHSISVSSKNTVIRDIIDYDEAEGVIKFTADGTYAGVAAYVIYKIYRSNFVPIIKTLTTITDTIKITDNTKLALLHTDGYKLTSVVVNGTDYTNSYEFDNGQRDDVYDFITLNAVSNNLPTNGANASVTYQYFEHSSSGDFFTVDSYIDNTFEYKDIPSYKGEFLGNYVDFRKSINRSPNKVTDGNFVADYEFYLPRKDKIVLNKKGVFTVLKGIPSLTPLSPKDADDSITLYELNIPAYTFDISDIVVNKLNYKRYTMKDISQLEKRIEGLEYYTTLSLLESDIQGKEFLDKFKSGFFVDNFESLTTADADSSLHTIAIDFVNNEMRPQTIINAVNMEANTLTGLKSHSNGIITLDYTETSMIQQTMASIVERIQPFAKYTWNGKVTLNPAFDNWISTTTVDLTLDNGTFPRNRQGEVLNSVFDSVGRFFIGNPTSPPTNSSARLDTAGNTSTREIDLSPWRRGWQLAARPVITSQTQFVGTRSIDAGAVPFIRSRIVEFKITGLKPNTKVSPYFDGVDISTYCATTIDGFTGTVATVQHPMITDGAGSLLGYFYIPNTDSVKFKTGNRKFTVQDAVDNPSTIGTGTYVANGTNIILQNVFVTTRFVEFEQFWRDPVAQSFVIENNGGAFVTSIDIFFGDVEGNTDDVKVQIRDMKNGYPSDNIIAEKLLGFDALAGSNNSAVSTKFTFDSPVYLSSGIEYCFVVISNSTDLTLWTSKLGEKNVLTGEYINKQPYLGSMFKSQNNKTWTAEQLQDIKFNINRASFNTTGELICFNKMLESDIGTEADSFHTKLESQPFSVNNGISYNIISGGSGYTTATVSFTVDSGIAPTATLDIGVGTMLGVIVGMNIVSYGSGYNRITATTISGIGGTGASIVTTVDTVQRIKVNHKNHGFNAGDKVTFVGATEFTPSYPIGVLNNEHVVSSVLGDDMPMDLDSYYIEPEPVVVNKVSVVGGGTNVSANNQINYSLVRLLSDTITVNGTVVDWSLQNKTVAGNTYGVAVGVTDGKVTDLEESKLIRSANDNSLRLKASISSNDNYLSPVIDTQRLTLYTYSNRIDNFYDANNVYDSKARYVSKKITLINPANELQVYLDNNMVSGSLIKVYCKLGTDTVGLYDTNTWNEMTVVSGGEFTSKNTYAETKYVFETDVDFNALIIKICMYTNIPVTATNYGAVVPKIKRLRGIALSSGA